MAPPYLLQQIVAAPAEITLAPAPTPTQAFLLGLMIPPGTAISGGIAPFAGTFRPETPLAAFNGKQMNGTWKLRVADTGALDVGPLGCVQLQITEQLYFCCGVDGDPMIASAPPATLVEECGTDTDR